MSPVKHSLVIALMLSLLTTACDRSTKKQEAPTKNLNTNSIVASNAKPGDKAEALARAAEEMLTANPLAFMFANEVLDSALKHDKNNLRANLLKRIIAPMMAYQGILNRVKPIVSDHFAADYQEAVDKVKTKYPKSFSDFLLNGPQDIKNEKDVQRFLDEQTQAYGAMRLFLKNNKKNSITLNLPLTMAAQLIDEVKLCEAKETSEGEYEYRECTIGEKTQAELTTADMEAIQHIYAGLEMYMIVLNSRDLSGAINVAKKFDGKIVSNEDRYKELIKNKDFAIVRNEKALKSIIDMGMDAVAGADYVASRQKELCPPQHYTPGKFDEESQYYIEDSKRLARRPGKALRNGICVGEGSDDEVHDFREIITAVNAGLKGEVVKLKYNAVDMQTGEYKERSMSARPSLLFTAPIKDLKNVKLTFDDCGNVTTVSDDKLGGALVNGGANRYLKETTFCAEEFVRRIGEGQSLEEALGKDQDEYQ